jgi:hypothetical protein
VIPAKNTPKTCELILVAPTTGLIIKSTSRRLMLEVSCERQSLIRASSCASRLRWSEDESFWQLEHPEKTTEAQTQSTAHQIRQYHFIRISKTDGSYLLTKVSHPTNYCNTPNDTDTKVDTKRVKPGYAG